MHKHIDKEALTTSLTTTSPSLTLSWLKKPDIAPDPYAILHDVPELTSKKKGHLSVLNGVQQDVIYTLCISSTTINKYE
jgi:hypothetical protein